MKIRGFEPISLKNKKNKGDAIPPSRADSGSAGYDFFSPSSFTLQPKDMLVVWTDVKTYMLADEVLKLYPRSSMGKVRVSFANGTGIIDSSYYNNPDNEGNIGLLLVNDGDDPFFIEYGQAIGQGIFQKFLFADNDVVRGKLRTGGFGSSDQHGGVTTEEAGRAMLKVRSTFNKHLRIGGSPIDN